MQLPSEVPVMTLPNVILFPQAMLPLYIFEPRYRKMLQDALETHRMFTIAMQKPGLSKESPSAVAGLGLIRASVKNKDGTSNLVLQGIMRVELESTVRYRPYRISRIRPLKVPTADTQAVEVLTQKLVVLVGQRLELGFDMPFKTFPELGDATGDSGSEPIAIQAFREVVQRLTKLDDPEQLADLISATLLPSPLHRQKILATASVPDRLRHLITFLRAEIRRMKARKA